jgi:hypothetical protein
MDSRRQSLVGTITEWDPVYIVRSLQSALPTLVEDWTGRVGWVHDVQQGSERKAADGQAAVALDRDGLFPDQVVPGLGEHDGTLLSTRCIQLPMVWRQGCQGARVLARLPGVPQVG